ncbi:uncharacterized protein LOC135703412 [Ochlerotatus camptorhynchus]|uniref:uncharacterized protein LOC135703412 n=1 Tax=Ochlerotatus camptorhynchus TaxID=644619 RepID=UPI0031D81C6C
MQSFVAVVFLVFGVLLHQSQGAAYTDEEHLNFRQKCSKILQISPDTRQEVTKKNFLNDNQEMNCMIRCVGILSGFYDDETGTNWDQVASELENKPESYDEHRQATAACIEAIPKEEYASDVCKKASVNFRCHSKSIRAIRARALANQE